MRPGTLLTLILIVLMSGTVMAGDFSVGLKVGANSTTLGTSTFPRLEPDMNARYGFSGGGFVTYELSRFFSLQTEVLYTSKGVEKRSAWLGPEDATIVEKVSLEYVEVPLLVKFHLPVRSRLTPGIFVGPSFAFSLSAKDAYSADDLIIGWTNPGRPMPRFFDGEFTIINKKSTDVGMVFGADVQFPLFRLSILVDVRYTVGLKSVFEEIDLFSAKSSEGESFFYEALQIDPIAVDTDDLNNRALSATIGVVFSL